MLEISSLSKHFSAPGGNVVALDNVSFSIDKGTFVSIVGKSGSGKSTLLSILGALENPSEGSVVVDGQALESLTPRQQTSYRAKKIGFVFQHYNLIPNLTAKENVILALEYGGYPKTSRHDRAEQLLDEVGIKDDQQHRLPGKLSGGQQQRVSIARALANNPSFILADEPTGNLDSTTGKKIFDLLHTLSRKEKTTIIVVTHDLDIAGKTDKILHLKDGHIQET